MKYLVSISYDGSKYYGFERQPKLKTIQGEIERVLKKISKEDITIKGAGRTDRGVHALDQKAHFELSNNIPCDGLKDAMNSLLDDYIYINYVKEVNEDFHARFDCASKTYEYYLNVGEYNPIKNDYIYNYNKPLNIGKMRKAAKYLCGMHSYEAFTAGERENYNSIVYKITISKKDNIIKFKFDGKSFYRYMVRNLVGILIDVGRGKIEPIDAKKTLEAKKNICGYVTAPACGLYLTKVNYK